MITQTPTPDAGGQARETSRIADAMKREYWAWQEVCRLLRQMNPDLGSDLAAPQGSMETDGQILIAALRTWGKAKQDLGGAREEKSTRGASQLSLV